MADLGTTTAPTPPAHGADETPAGRRVRRRRPLPGGRAVAGAFLITAAAVGVFAAYLNATAAPSTEWLVATQDIPRGTEITRPMLDTVAMDVPEALQPALLEERTLDSVVGRMTLGPVRAGDLLQDTAVLSDAPPENASTFTFSLPSSRVALEGGLSSGDTIDVVATYSDTTLYVARDVELVASPAPGDSGTSITVAIPDPATVLAIANALDTADVFVLRSPPQGSSDQAPPPFRPQTQGGGGGAQ